LNPKHPETCRYCGARIHFLADPGDHGGTRSLKTGWVVLNAADWTKHQCAKSAAKVYTPEERAEFQRRREAGEV